MLKFLGLGSGLSRASGLVWAQPHTGGKIEITARQVVTSPSDKRSAVNSQASRSAAG